MSRDRTFSTNQEHELLPFRERGNEFLQLSAVRAADLTKECLHVSNEMSYNLHS